MELKYVELNNYRQYIDQQRIDLATSSQNRINVIEGQNGAGKSNFLNALTLCLYGREEHGSEDRELESQPYVTERLLTETESDEGVSGHIEVCFGREREEYIFRREFATQKREDGGYHNILEEPTLQALSDGDWRPIENPNTILNQIIPQYVYQYFFFDGEDLDVFFDRTYQDNIRNGVVDVSQVDLLDRTLYHLGKIHSDLENEMAELGGRTEELINERESLEEDIEEQEELIQELEDEIENHEDEIEEIDTTLQDARDERVIELRTRRENIEKQLDEYESELQDVFDETSDILLTAGPPILSYSALRSAHTELENATPQGNVPAGVDTELINALLDQEICICGADLSESSEHRDHLKHVSNELSGISQEYIQGRNLLPKIMDSASERVPLVKTKREEIRDLEDSISDMQYELQDISNELKSYDIPEDIDVQAKEERRRELINRIQEVNRRIGSLENELEDMELEHDQLEREIRRERRKDERLERISNELDFVEAVEEDISNIRSKIIGEIRTETEKRMEQYYNELIWKDDEFNVVLNEDYSVEVYREGDPSNLLGALSAGERQVLALSFMASIARISGFEAPTVIDTPLGRISSRPRKRIAENLPDYLEDTQITFLMTDEEYTAQVKSILSDHLAHEYLLDYHNGVTEVVPHG